MKQCRLTYTLQTVSSMTAMDQPLSEAFTERLSDGVTARRSDVSRLWGKNAVGL
jgi:hypothetical protein